MVLVCALCSLGPTLVPWYTAAGIPWVSPATRSHAPRIDAYAMAVPVDARRQRTITRTRVTTARTWRNPRTGWITARWVASRPTYGVPVLFGPVLWPLVARW